MNLKMSDRIPEVFMPRPEEKDVIASSINMAAIVVIIVVVVVVVVVVIIIVLVTA